MHVRGIPRWLQVLLVIALALVPAASGTLALASPSGQAADLPLWSFSAELAPLLEPGAFTITPTAGPNGAIDPAVPQTVALGGTAEFTIIPDVGYHIADVLVDGVSVGAVSTYTFADVGADHTIEASFAVDTFTIAASAGLNGSIAPSGSSTVAYGDDLTLHHHPGRGLPHRRRARRRHLRGRRPHLHLRQRGHRPHHRGELRGRHLHDRRERRR